MGPLKRRSNTSLEESLLNDAYHFDFVQLVRILESLSPDVSSLGEGSNPRFEALSIKSHVTLAVSSSEVQGLTRIPPDAGTSLEQSFNRFEAHINFLGLAGIQGPLPTPYTELLLDRIRQKDYSFKDFLDIFNHRLVSLWYRLQKKMTPIISGKLPYETRLGQSIFDLAGFPKASLFEATAIPQGALVNCAALFWQRPRSQEGLTTILKNYLGVKATVFPFQGRWQHAEARDLTRLGPQAFDFVPEQKTNLKGQYNRLGIDARLGTKSWNQQGGILIHIGPLKGEDFSRLLPSSPQGHFGVLQALCRLYVGLEADVNISLEVAPQEIRPSPLGKTALGWNSWCLGGDGHPQPKFPPHLSTQTVVKIYAIQKL